MCLGGVSGSERSEIGIRVKAKVVKNKVAPPYRCVHVSNGHSKTVARRGRR
jgi:hypothetical protein